ncbi:MAG: bacterial transcriptional activator domain-containing protein [Caldilineaceae bacterium]
MNAPNQQMFPSTYADEGHSPIMICLLGNFCLLKAGEPVGLRHGGKTVTLLSHLGLQHRHGVPRTTLLQMLWPTQETALANQSLHTVVYSLHKLIGDAIGGAPPVFHEEGCYRLNRAAGVSVDVARFEMLVKLGDQQARTGDLAAAAGTYQQAVDLYRGDLCVDGDVQALMLREHLRARYLTLLAQLADYHYHAGAYGTALEYAWRLLGYDPCREDAHRLVMRCYVRQGERAAALRHYQICAQTLHAEFGADPEAATTALFVQIRLDPSSV